jgi:GrpB-like predicted nucleotidyltransferase (UPF0157 family)
MASKVLVKGLIKEIAPEPRHERHSSGHERGHAASYIFAEGRGRGTSRAHGRRSRPEASVAARERGSAASVRRILGDKLADSPGLVRACRSDHQGRDERAYRRTGDVRRHAHPSGAERPGRRAPR